MKLVQQSQKPAPVHTDDEPSRDDMWKAIDDLEDRVTALENWQEEKDTRRAHHAIKEEHCAPESDDCASGFW